MQAHFESLTAFMGMVQAPASCLSVTSSILSPAPSSVSPGGSVSSMSSLVSSSSSASSSSSSLSFEAIATPLAAPVTPPASHSSCVASPSPTQFAPMLQAKQPRQASAIKRNYSRRQHHKNGATNKIDLLNQQASKKHQQKVHLAAAAPAEAAATPIQPGERRKRLAANARERKRMHLLNKAYDELRRKLVDAENKSKYDVLVQAKEYIQALAKLCESDRCCG